MLQSCCLLLPYHQFHPQFSTVCLKVSLFIYLKPVTKFAILENKNAFNYLVVAISKPVLFLLQSVFGRVRK